MTKTQFQSDTITVGELLGALQEFPKDLPVRITWKGIGHAIDRDHVYLVTRTTVPCVLLDGDECTWKRYFQDGAYPNPRAPGKRERSAAEMAAEPVPETEKPREFPAAGSDDYTVGDLMRDL